VLTADALAVGEKEIGTPAPTVLAANLPYNVAVPVVLHLLAVLPSLLRGVVMVQAEVADRMCAGPGSRVYGIPSAKLAWYASAKPAGTVPRNVFWPVPNVDSKLVTFTRRDPPPTTASRAEVFAVIDAAFGQRRKTLRAALATWAGSPAQAESALRAAGVDPGARGESLAVTDFARIAQHRPLTACLCARSRSKSKSKAGSQCWRPRTGCGWCDQSPSQKPVVNGGGRGRGAGGAEVFTRARRPRPSKSAWPGPKAR
jgi:16S rRNA (adenine1518-N6/adenine1519-N6)-dimethyltransferase